jgi:Tc5 transposase DNA-binding domain
MTLADFIIQFSESGKKKARQLPGSGRPLKSKEFDDALAIWVRDQRQKKLRVSRRMIQEEAKRTAKLYFVNEDEEVNVFQVIQIFN